MSKTQNIQIILRARPTANESEHIKLNTLDKTIEIEHGDSEELANVRRKDRFTFNGIKYFLYKT